MRPGLHHAILALAAAVLVAGAVYQVRLVMSAGRDVAEIERRVLEDMRPSGDEPVDAPERSEAQVLAAMQSAVTEVAGQLGLELDSTEALAAEPRGNLLSSGLRLQLSAPQDDIVSFLAALSDRPGFVFGPLALNRQAAGKGDAELLAIVTLYGFYRPGAEPAGPAP